MTDHVHKWALMRSRMGVMVYECIGCGKEAFQYVDD